MNSKVLEQSTIGNYYFELLANPKFIVGLNSYDLDKIKSYAEKIVFDEIDRDHNLLTSEKIVEPDSYTKEYLDACTVYKLIDDLIKKSESDKIRDTHTISDRFLYELAIIEDIFRSQVNNFQDGEEYKAMRIFNLGSEPIHGCYSDLIDVFSDAELFNLPQYERYYTERAEIKLIQNNLKEILDYAKYILAYYKNSIEGNTDLFNLQGRQESGYIENSEISSDKNYAIAWINKFQITKIKIGNKRVSKTYEVFDKPKFIYNWTNSDLRGICLHIIEFIEKFELTATFESKSSVDIEELNITSSQNLQLFIKGLFLDFKIDSEICDDFIKLVKKQHLKTSNQIIHWTNDQYLLLYMIQNLEKYKIIDIEPYKFIIDNFSFPKQKLIKKSYLQTLNKKYTKTSDEIRTKMSSIFNQYLKDVKPNTDKKLNIRTL